MLHGNWVLKSRQTWHLAINPWVQQGSGTSHTNLSPRTQSRIPSLTPVKARLTPVKARTGHLVTRVECPVWHGLPVGRVERRATSDVELGRSGDPGSRFELPRLIQADQQGIEVTSSQLSLILDGIELSSVKQRSRFQLRPTG